MKPEISLIVPVYNKEKYLKKCIDSLKKQSLDNIEIICIDDGSTDNSPKILEQLSKEDKRIKIITQENSGPGYARNTGLKNATGEYIAFIDADDWIEQETLEKLYINAKQNDSDLIIFNAVEHHPNNKTRNRIYYNHEINGTFNFHDKKDIVMNNYLIVCTKLHKNQFIQKNNIKFPKGLFEDVYFHIESTLKAQKISYINEMFYHYRRTQENTRQNESLKSNKNMQFLQTLKNIKQLLQDNNAYNELKENYANFKLTELKNLYNNTSTENKEEFYNILKEDFKEDKLNIENIADDKRQFYQKILNSEDFKQYNDNLIDKKEKRILKKFSDKFRKLLG